MKKIEKKGDTFSSYNDYLEDGIEYWKEKLRHVSSI